MEWSAGAATETQLCAAQETPQIFGSLTRDGICDNSFAQRRDSRQRKKAADYVSTNQVSAVSFVEASEADRPHELDLNNQA
jgi:hypothetical protein